MIKKDNFGLLESTLNPVTLRYLNSKYQVNDNNELLEKKDLRHMCENVTFSDFIKTKYLGDCRARINRKRRSF